jgi:dTDP-4-dehydrorhamnose reductase
MKILILGSNGFVGNNFNKFLQNKNCEVEAINRGDCDFLNKDALFKTLKEINAKDVI